MSKIIAFAGSARRDSLNKKLIRFAADLTREAGAEVTLIDLAEYPMPLYDGDVEDHHGIPETAERLFQLMLEHDGLLWSCPEYNSSITPLLKNTIDWLSRPRKDQPRLAAFRGKVAGLLSASPGQLGGLRGLVHVRSILQNIGVIVVPTQMALAQAHEAFTDTGSLKDPKQTERLRQLIHELVRTTELLHQEHGQNAG